MINYILLIGFYVIIFVGNMIKKIEELTEIKLVGISTITSNAQEFNPNTAKIADMMKNFFTSEIQTKIINKKNSGRVFAVYTKYENNEHGNYTYFIGEEVTSFDDVAQDLEKLTIPGQQYIKFASETGKMPDIVIDLWQKIWKMNAEALNGERAYIADFEVYDERCKDINNAIMDIYIGIKNNI